MLSARAYSVRQKSRLAVSLSWVGGYTNAVAFLYCSRVVSHVTGTTTSLSVAISQCSWTVAGSFAFILAMFWLGAVASGFMTEGARRRGRPSKYVLPMAVEALMLCLFAIGIERNLRLEPNGSLRFFWIVGVASFAMGLQNATITKISGAVVRTTHLTGVVTDIGLEGVQLLLWYRDLTRGRAWSVKGRVFKLSQRHPSLQRIVVLGGILGSFVTGAIVAGCAFPHFAGLSMTVPVTFLLLIVLIDWLRPIADIREIDAINDPELRVYGILKAILPPELGIYRLFSARRSPHRAPNFQLWVDRLPARWRVIILSLSPNTRFDSNAFLDLHAALQRLHSDGRTLIIAGITPLQYRALEALGIAGSMDIENLCSDLEFAIARGISIVRDGAGRESRDGERGVA